MLELSIHKMIEFICKIRQLEMICTFCKACALFLMEITRAKSSHNDLFNDHSKEKIIVQVSELLLRKYHFSGSIVALANFRGKKKTKHKTQTMQHWKN